MSDGDPIPDADHVTRVCGRGFENDEITSTAFALNDKDREVGNKLSVDWVECAHTTPTHRNLEASLKRLKRRIPLTGQPIAELNAEQIRQIRRNGQQLDAVESHRRKWSCHGAIIGMTDGPIDLDLQEDLARLANSGDIVTLS